MKNISLSLFHSLLFYSGQFFVMQEQIFDMNSIYHYRSHDQVWLLVSSADQCLSRIWVENKRDIHSSIACLWQVYVVKPIPLHIKPELISSNLKAGRGHRHVTINSIGGPSALAVVFSLGNSPPSDAISSSHCYAIVPSLPHYVRWPLTLQESSSALW